MRIERDSLGEKLVPDNVYYGIQTARAQENFAITGLHLYPPFIHALGVVKRACAQANLERGRLPRAVGEAICQAAAEVAEGRWDDQFVVDPIQGGAGTSINMNANEVIANRALEILGQPRGAYHIIHPVTHVNMSQSTNDVVPTALRITLLDVLRSVVDEVEGLSSAFLAKAEEVADVVKVGRTHLQDAVPIRLGQEFAAYARALKRDADRIRKAREGLKEVNIGGTAIGTSLNADPVYRARVLELLREFTGHDLRAPDDYVDATQNQDALLSVSQAMRGCAATLTKVANDLRLMASGPRAGLGEIVLPALQPGSSIMPGKVNPVVPEAVNQIAFQVMGNDLTVSLAVQAGQFELNVMLPVIAFNLLQSAQLLERGCALFRERCVVGIQPNRDRCREQAENSIGLATVLNPYIGYDRAAEVAKEALRTGRTVWEVVRQRGILPDEQLRRLLEGQGIQLSFHRDEPSERASITATPPVR